MLWPSVLLIEAPALLDFAGTGLSPILWPWRLGLPLGHWSLGRTGEYFVLQTGLPTGEQVIRREL